MYTARNLSFLKSSGNRLWSFSSWPRELPLIDFFNEGFGSWEIGRTIVCTYCGKIESAFGDVWRSHPGVSPCKDLRATSDFNQNRRWNPPVHPQLRHSSVRLTTFESRPFDSKHIASLVDNGFFVTGIDEVTCFYCGVALSHLTADDKVVSEHLRYSPYCVHANLSKTDSLRLRFEAAESDDVDI